MSTSTKTPASIRQGGPGSSHENAKAPLDVKKPANDDAHRSHVSGGGGETDHRHPQTRAHDGASSRHSD